jgi:hypothetical protein
MVHEGGTRPRVDIAPLVKQPDILYGWVIGQGWVIDQSTRPYPADSRHDGMARVRAGRRSIMSRRRIIAMAATAALGLVFLSGVAQAETLQLVAHPEGLGFDVIPLP